MKPQQDSSPNPLPPEATGAPPSQQSILFKVLSAAFSGALVVLILVWFHKQMAQYGTDVKSAIDGLDAVQVVGLLVGGFVIMTLNSMAMRTPLTGVTTGRAFIAQQASTAVSNVIPGPSGTAARFAILYSWKVTVEDFTRGTVAVSIWGNVCMISMPGLAFLVLAASGETQISGGELALLALVAVVVSVVAVGVCAGALRSERFARWLGRVTAAIVNPLRRLFRRARIEHLDESAAELRQRTVDILAAKKARLTAIVVGAYWLNGLLLVVCMWAAGVPRADLGLLVGLALYSVGRIGTIIQVTPGGVGVVEVVYSAVFMAVVPEQYNAQVVTGVLLYRLLTYILPILTGGVCYLLWRGIRHHERTEAIAT